MNGWVLVLALANLILAGASVWFVIAQGALADFPQPRLSEIPVDVRFYGPLYVLIDWSMKWTNRGLTVWSASSLGCASDSSVR